MAEFRVLGPLEIVDGDGAPVDVGGRQPRTMLAMLLVAGGRSVPVDAIIETIWGDRPPPSATGTVQSYASRLRRQLDSNALLLWDEAGYRLQVPANQVDAWRFEQLVDEGRQLLAQADHAAGSERLAEADSLWRGPALVEFADLDFANGVATRLEEQRISAVEDRLDAELELGHHQVLAGQLQELVARHPLRERLAGQLALALYRSGRQAEALRTLAHASTVLREQLGIEPSRPLRELEAAILHHDPMLDRDGPSRATASATAHTDDVPSRPPASTLVGRATELADLTTAFHESAHSARFAVIEGEPGIGKTRLADELRALAAASGAIAVWGRADEGGAAPALWPWLAPLRAIGAHADSGQMPPALDDLLTGQTLAPNDAVTAVQFERFERFEAIAQLLQTVAQTQPVVILLDDLQWADSTSLELLSFLASRLDRGVLVVSTVRQLEVGRNDAVTDALARIARRPGSRRLQLRGLSRVATAEVLDAVTAQHLPPAVTASIHERADGNPFYAIELARLLDEEGALGEEVPGGVGDVIRRRLARLTERTVQLLGTAAVVGRDVDLELLAAAEDRSFDDCLDTLEPAVIHRLLAESAEQPTVLRFSHALVREVLLEDLSALRRARLHLKVADAIEARGAHMDQAEILAEHLWRAAPIGVGQRAAEALEQAAEVALRRVSYRAAEELLTKAVRLRQVVGHSPAAQEAELRALYRLLEVARARWYFQGVAGETVQRAKELAEQCGQHEMLLNLVWFEWSAHATSCRPESEVLAHAFHKLTIDDPRPVVRATGVQVLGVACWGAGRIADAVEMLDTAEALFVQGPVSDDAFTRESRLVTKAFQLFNHAAHGDWTPEQVLAGYDEMLATFSDRFAVASICGFAATVALTLGAWDDVERYLAIGDEADPEPDFDFWNGQRLMMHGVLRARDGDAAEAQKQFHRGQQQYVGLEGHSALPSYQASLALQLASHGEHDAATTFLDAAYQELAARHERWNEPIVLIADAVVAQSAGQFDRAQASRERAIEVATKQGAHGYARRAEHICVPNRGGLSPE